MTLDQLRELLVGFKRLHLSWAFQFSKKLRLSGEPFPVVQQVALADDQVLSLFSVSDNGTLVYRSGVPGSRRLAWYARDGAHVGWIGEPGRYKDLSLSPDEKRVAVVRRGVTYEIWTIELSTDVSTRLTDRLNVMNPVWSPDGRELGFMAWPEIPRWELYRRVVGGGGEELLFAANDEMFRRQWLKDGSIVFGLSDAGEGGRAIYRLGTAGKQQPSLLLKTESGKDSPQVSPDGRWVAYQSDESGRFEVYLAAFPAFTEKRRVSNGDGYQPLWRKDGKELFYLTVDGKVMSVNVKGGARAKTDVPRVLFQGPARVEPKWGAYSVTGDGKKFIFLEPVETKRPFTVVLNWTTGLKK
jgi:Tol biopolymer transport system component